MKHLAIIFCSASLLMVGCGDDDGGGGNPDATVSNPDAGNPPAPSLGTQIDRTGRPAITTALINPLNLDSMQTANRNAYNQDAARAGWGDAWSPAIRFMLGVLDGLDSTTVDNCGNQFGFNAADPVHPYQTLAGVLAVDMLLINSSLNGTTAGYSLAVETGVTTASGGRMPTDDVVDASYTVLTGATSTVGDGVANDSPQLSDTVFPFLQAPN